MPASGGSSSGRAAGDIRRTGAGSVRADASVTINGLVRWTINHGCAGLEAWAGTPGTVGGAIFGNAHFAGRLIGDLVTRAGLVSRSGVATEAAAAELAFDHEGSRATPDRRDSSLGGIRRR